MDIEQVGEQRYNGPVLCLIAQETRQTSLQLCEEALIARETAQEIMHLCQLARERRGRVIPS